MTKAYTAYPVLCDKPGSYETFWRVWRPDRIPHLFSKYKDEKSAQKAADKINVQNLEWRL